MTIQYQKGTTKPDPSLARQSRRALITTISAATLLLKCNRASAIPGHALTFSIKDFGAKGDGVSDDNHAFEACCDAASRHGGWVDLGTDKTYLIGRREGFTIADGVKGFINSRVTIKINPRIIYTGAIFTINSNNLQICDISFDTDSSKLLRPELDRVGTIICVKAKNVTLTRLRFYGRAHHFILGCSGCDGLSISDVTISTTGLSPNGVYIGDRTDLETKNITVVRLTIEGLTSQSRSFISRHSIGLYKCVESLISNCTVWGGGQFGFGISLNFCDKITIDNNAGNDCVREFINATKSSNTFITGNTCRWLQTEKGALHGVDFGISIEGSRNLKIYNNTINGSQKSGIGCAADTGDSSNNMFLQNKIIDCAWASASISSAIFTYASQVYTNRSNIFKQNAVVNTDSRLTEFFYYETAYGEGTVGLNKIYNSPYTSKYRCEIGPTSKLIDI